MALVGFDDRGAAAALHAVTADSFKVSGVHRDTADFTVLKIWDADDFYSHPRLKRLPSFDFSGMVLEFDVHYDTGLIPFDSAKSSTIDWDVLSLKLLDESMVPPLEPTVIPLFENAVYSSGTYNKASVTFTVSTPGTVMYNRISLWFNNIGFDYWAGISHAAGLSASDVATILANAINTYSWSPGDQEIEAVAVGADITISASKPGSDGNMIRLYSLSHDANLTLLSGGLDYGQMSGGVSDAVWHVTIDFDAFFATKTWGAPDIRQMWFTYAPAIPDSAAFAPVPGKEFAATYTNWKVTGANKALQVAGPGSVRIEENDAWCTYSGSSWGLESGFYSKGFAKRATTAGDSVRIKYWCQHVHDLYIGTSLYLDRGEFSCSLDGDAATTLDAYLNSATAVVTRVKIRSAVPAGEHTVILTADGSGPVYFDFLEAAVPDDVPDPDTVYTDRAPACDYGTDHTYKRAPYSLLWEMDTLGYQGPLNVYVSVFWWNQRLLNGRSYPAATIDFNQTTWADGDAAFIDISGLIFGKSVFNDDTVSTIARHFTFFINQTAVGVWAEDDGAGLLTIYTRSVGTAYSFSCGASKEPSGGGAVALTVGGSLTGGTYGTWIIDPMQTPAINRGTYAWLSDLCAECASRGRELTLVYSMELLNPPDDPPSDVWASRYWDGTAVTTATGFASNVTTHCSFSDKMLAYQKQVFLDTAAIMDAAGLDVILQVGEFLWWFFPGTGPFGTKGMAFYDAYTTAQAAASLGRPLARFSTPVDDPGVNGGADVAFLAQTLVDYIAAIRTHVKATYPAAEIEILLPYDVNYPSRAGVNNLGGRLNYAVNVPAAFLDPVTAPFDRVKMEALDWQVGSRDQNKAVETMQLPYRVGTWDKSKVRFLCGLFNGGAPWVRAAQRAFGDGLVVNYWAWDHVCLFGWNLADSLHPSAPES